MSLIRIALTGGPCGGKTSALPFLRDKLRAKGFNAVTVPESATLLFNHGFDLTPTDNYDKNLIRQTAMINCHKSLEDAMAATEILTGKPTIVLSDRGLMDCKVYTPPNVWSDLLERYRWSDIKFREGRYDAVFHMESAAIGTDFYTKSNNAARIEGAEAAVAADHRTKMAWMGHPHLRIIDNSTDFDGKLNRLWKAVEHFIDPNKKEIERRFLVKNWVRPNDMVSINIIQHYLKSDDGVVRRIRDRHQSDSLYYLTTKEVATGIARTEHETLVSYERYLDLLNELDSNKRPIHKERKYFIWKNRQYELDVFGYPHNGMVILEAEMDDPAEPVEIPPYIEVEKEVTNDSSYSNWHLAARV